MIRTSASSRSGGVSIRKNPLRVRAMFAGHVLADSAEVLTLRRPGQRPVHFFPLKDVETGYFGRTAPKQADPLLGPTTFLTLVIDGEIVERAARAYEEPAAETEALRGYICFSDDIFEIYRLTAGDLAASPRATHIHRSAA